MYTDSSTTDEFPKTLLIRNSEGGMIWQVYHVESNREAKRLAANATRNGFLSVTLENYLPEHEETFPDWRQTQVGIID